MKLQWNQIDWKKAEEQVNRLQIRIVKATLEQKLRLVKRLQYLITNSFYAKALAVKRVVTNRGKKTPGIDGELWRSEKEKVNAIKSLGCQTYHAKPLKRVYIEKFGRKEKRPLGIPTMRDRAMQALQLLALEPVAETTADRISFGFRKYRSPEDAREYAFSVLSRKDSPQWILEGDIKSCFDKISHQWMMDNIPGNKRIMKEFMRCGYVEKGKLYPTIEGSPQGGPLSPLLSNVMLNELDKELESRGHRFVRYADDCMIFCKSRKSAERTLKNIIPFIEGKLFLKVNRKKTEVAHISKVKYLGYTFYRYKGKCRFRVHQKSVEKMKNKIRELTDRNKGISNAVRERKYQEYVQGWVEYFRLADMKGLLKATDEWARRRIRAVYWKQWKKIKTKYRMLKALGMEHWKAKELACSRKGYWRMAKVLNQIFSKKIIAKLGYTTMLDYYLTVCEN